MGNIAWGPWSVLLRSNPHPHKSGKAASIVFTGGVLGCRTLENPFLFRSRTRERGLARFSVSLLVKLTSSAYDHWTEINPALSQGNTNSYEHVSLDLLWIDYC
jgi:hypothetical protein